MSLGRDPMIRQPRGTDARRPLFHSSSLAYRPGHSNGDVNWLNSPETAGLAVIIRIDVFSPPIGAFEICNNTF
jgi:hypothetical protein